MESSWREQEASTLTTQLLGDDENGKPPRIDNGDSAITPILLCSVFVAVCGSFAYGTALGYSSPVESAIMDELDLSIAEYSLFGSLLTVGGLVGSLASGKIADLVGRRCAMGLADALSLVGWISISISEEAWSLILGRFFIGSSAGLTLFLVPVYIAEIAPNKLRGGFVSLSQLMASSGLIVMFFVGSVIPWRLLVLTGIIPSLLQLLGLFFIPESPRFLAKHGHRHEIVLQRLRGDNIDTSQEAADIQDSTQLLEQIPDVGFWGLFKRKYAHALVVVFGLMLLSAIAGPGGLTFYASSVFESAGFSSSIGSIVLAVVQLPSVVISIYLIDKCGRRFLLMISAAGMCICCFLVGLMFLFKENDCLQSISTYLIVLGLWGYSAAFPIGIAGIPNVIMSEIFPMNVKGSAGSLAIFVLSGGAWIASYTFNFMINWSYPGTFFILAGLNGFAVLFVERLIPETRGRTLEDIQETF